MLIFVVPRHDDPALVRFLDEDVIVVKWLDECLSSLRLNVEAEELIVTAVEKLIRELLEVFLEAVK